MHWHAAVQKIISSHSAESDKTWEYTSRWNKCTQYCYALYRNAINSAIVFWWGTWQTSQAAFSFLLEIRSASPVFCWHLKECATFTDWALGHNTSYVCNENSSNCRVKISVQFHQNIRCLGNDMPSTVKNMKMYWCKVLTNTISSSPLSSSPLNLVKCQIFK